MPVEWEYEAATLTTRIIIPKQSKSQPIAVMAMSVGSITALDVQRAGAPFAHFVQYSTPEEATKQLGHVILAAPTGDAAHAGDTYSAEIAFALHRNGATEMRVVKIAEATTSHVIPTPFACEGIAMTMWEAEVMLHWREMTTRTRFRSAALFPAIPVWRVTLYNLDEVTLTPTDVLDVAGNPNPQLTWQTFAQSLAETVNYRHAYFTYLKRTRWSTPTAEPPLAAYLTATVTTPEAREAILAFTANGPVTVYVNGVKVGEDAKAAIHSVHGLFVHGTRFTHKLYLRAGTNTLLIHYPKADRRWHFGATLLSPSGELLPDLTF